VAIGSGAIASSALPLGGNYTATVTASGGFSLVGDSGCTLQGNGTASLDSKYNIYDLHVTGTCSGAAVVLDGVAVYRPAGSASPLDGSALAKDTLVIELSDFISDSGAPTRALVLIAPRTS
jgi:hypothetical protein